MRILHSLVNRLNDRGPLLILTPCARSIGNCSEEILFGLIRARREGKKLLLLWPYELPGKLRFRLPNREIFQVASPHMAEPHPLLRALGRLALTVVYGAANVLNRVIMKIRGPEHRLPEETITPYVGTTTLWKPQERVPGFDWDIVSRYRWPEELQAPLRVGLDDRKRSRAEGLAREMGLPKDAWFVGLHVREGGFHNDHAASACRNARIENYIPAIREITRRGGWLVRLGDSSMTKLPPMARVIDYPHTPYKSELMDVYLLSHCRFYVGMSSGIMDTAFLFQRPMVLTNMTNMTFVFPRRPEDRGLPKHVFSKSRGRFLSTQEILTAPWESQHFTDIGSDFDLVENSPEELLEVLIEFMDGLDRGGFEPTALQREANRLRREHGRRLLSQTLFPDAGYDLHTRYRVASRLDSALGSLSRSYLERNWRASAKTRPSAGVRN